MAPSDPNDTPPAEIAACRQAIIDRIQREIDAKCGLFREGYYIPAFGLLSTSIRRSDMAYVKREVIPNLRKILRDGNGLPFSEDVQVLGLIETEGEDKCECDPAPCRCAIRRTLKVMVRKRQGVPAYIQDANQHANQ